MPLVGIHSPGRICLVYLIFGDAFAPGKAAVDPVCVDGAGVAAIVDAVPDRPAGDSHGGANGGEQPVQFFAARGIAALSAEDDGAAGIREGGRGSQKCFGEGFFRGRHQQEPAVFQGFGRDRVFCLKQDVVFCGHGFQCIQGVRPAVFVSSVGGNVGDLCLLPEIQL